MKLIPYLLGDVHYFVDNDNVIGKDGDRYVYYCDMISQYYIMEYTQFNSLFKKVEPKK